MTDTIDQGLVPAVPLAVVTPEPLTSKQDGEKQEIKRDANGRLLPGQALNPNGVGGFQDHPEIINEGGRPKKQESFTWWINKFKNMSQDEFLSWDEKTPDKEKTVASALAYARVFAARTSLKDFREIADRSEGKAPQTIIFDGGFFSERKLEISEVSNDLEIEQEAEISS